MNAEALYVIRRLCCRVSIDLRIIYCIAGSAGDVNHIITFSEQGGRACQGEHGL